MTPRLSRRSFVAGAGAAAAMALAMPRGAVAAPAVIGGDTYVVQWRKPRQTLLGLGYEIQSDSIGSGNNGLPDATTSVPHDLVERERNRFYREMLRGGGDRGFRYCRLAMGLYLRGLTPDQKNVIGRWPEQLAELRDMMVKGRVEGLQVEYWSPTPAWKSNDSYIRGTLKSGDQAFLSDFADALVQDVRYLQDNGLPVSWWGLQNEPSVSTFYSTCTYTGDLYYNAFRTAASRMRSTFPRIRIHANSQDGQHGPGVDRIRADRGSLALVDGWTWHRIGTNTDELLPGRGGFAADNEHRAVFNNEFEYLSWDLSRKPWYTVNTAQSVMNWMVFHDSPTWIWLHALKPTYNSEALGYSLGFWRPWDDDDDSHFPDLEKGHWTWNPMNWNGVAGFLRHLPWDSVRVEVDEPAIDGDHRVMAWQAPGGARSFVVTNRTATPYTFAIRVGANDGFTGSRYAHDVNAADLGRRTGDVLTVEVPAYSIEFWSEV
ncbi:hypothetical protein [Jiangella alba]|uniref:hypothetical protein n=1 Tax=Jiangella alba TaxID=561176 RepID=UPI00083ED0CF|nr:hypothetical protein [Jiangella alba]